jgi:CHASE3 domain sensor protein
MQEMVKENTMSAIKQVLSEALGVEHTEEIKKSVTETESEHISRLRQLSGLANSTTVAGTAVAEAGGGLGLAYQRVLDQEYARCETQIMIAVGKIKQYAAKVNSMSDDMSDDEQAHYMYSIRGLLDIMEEELKDLQKLG